MALVTSRLAAEAVQVWRITLPARCSRRDARKAALPAIARLHARETATGLMQLHQFVLDHELLPATSARVAAELRCLEADMIKLSAEFAA